ncbi:uncharacterized protein N7443_009377 [Penicillium atrosanguineum]|uniref:uncharacterized protein n=1 Tax=Penicillium atrosanguineum TaxID=1132637 RepID=UPI00238EB199|nr:uncharacterized protein N7443_009377 [Penicillium atrosanguineum]KAJ5126333.1 DNA damage-inducible protein 1 [Penicillium atrosanguineum]KAJ5293424.1 hypothetical protein N7443_009377 [Penicillium atrosanguineum]
MLSARSSSTSGLSHPEKITLYVIAAAAGFLIILGLMIGISRSRHHKACKNQARGVTKAILKKIPIIQYNHQITITPKSSFDGSVSDSALDEKFVESRASSCPVCRVDLKPKTQQLATATATKKGEMTPDLEQGQTQTRHIRSLHDRIVEDLYGLR